MPYKKRDLPLLHQKNVKQGEIVNEKQKYEKIILKISLYAGMAFVVVELFDVIMEQLPGYFDGCGI